MRPARNWLGTARAATADHPLPRRVTMKKLRLDLEQLAIESFPTASRADARGTVAAHDATPGCTIAASCICSLGDTACDLTWHCTGDAAR